MRQASFFEEPTLLSPGVDRAFLVNEIAGLGATHLRIVVPWRTVARDGWGAVDEVVDLASGAGLQVMLTPSSPIPRAASRCRPRGPSCSPSVPGFRRFVRSLGRRYPQVRLWSVWNEPNLATWLQPQYRGSRLVSAPLYRRLVGAAVSALRASGHGSDVVLAGETAPVGRALGPPALRNADPVSFVSALFSRGRLRGVSGYAHHPYTQGAGAPPDGRLSPGQISYVNLRVLRRLLPSGMPVWLTEFGYQSNPPDFRLGVSLEDQARWINYADFVAARLPWVRSVSQYQLVDDQDVVGFQTGLRRFGSFSAKPALDAYRLPLWIARRGARLLVYGQVRPSGRRPVRVVLSRSGSRVASWRVRGQFVRRVRYRPGPYVLSAGDLQSRTAVAR